ncbi:helix-turn-helix domain-containing protein [Actinophytocola xanthii]|uniref:HTH cro/C1-type domain-containing protein n=1 Tax=Actinophytocola xanthii TaxID=1912961 RepID=A0A1Q8CPK3_9PSEU|nr:helix-turn-helix transcriptional regulator [Actinophytocola xanthii]OLF16287.1 hypothetical protein BU204_16985 [Actinophytocola xanthii]
MNSAEDPAVQLARRLRSLRVHTWPHRRITQAQLAEALRASVPLISSWENTKKPTVPPRARLAAYARFFATERSLASTPYRVPDELDEQEHARAEELLEELLKFSTAALNKPDEDVPTTAESPLGGGIWRFQPGQDVTIVCSELPRAYLDRMPYTDPEAPDYVALYRLADLDALLELFGHVRAANPRNEVRFRTPAEIKADDLTTHLVLLGGVDWNRITGELLRREDLPVRQQPRPTDAEPAGFEVDDGDGPHRFAPVLSTVEGREVLDEDVGHFYRAPNPFNAKRTVTICNGMYQRGTYGAVRALTDAKFRDRNDEYLRTRFGERRTFSVLCRVPVVNHQVITPDWTIPEIRLHEWPPDDREHERGR